MKKILTGVTLLLGITAISQDSTQKGSLSLSGSVDAYYRYNFNNAKEHSKTNNFTSYTNSQNSFELGMASIKGDYTLGKVEGVVDLGFGRRAEETSYNDQGALTAVKQAYFSYSPSTHVKFTMGKWFTHLGYEVPDAWLNRNYSMDYIFTNSPFFHTGIKMDVTASNNFAFMVGISNPTDMITSSFAKKYFIAQLHGASTNNKLSAYLNYVGGKDMSDASVNQIDAVVTGTICPKFSIGYNGTVKFVKPSGGSSESWWGSALYLNYDPSNKFGLTARGEYFGDKKGVAGLGTSIFDFTLSGDIHIDNLTIIPEFRLDGAKDPIFFKDTDGSLPSVKSTGTFILGAAYHF